MKVAVMASGRGSNFQALINASKRGEMPDVELVLLIVNKSEARAIKIAEENNITCKVIISNGKTREEFDQQALRLLKEMDIKIIVLAGFMKILSPEFIKTYKNKILNIHPSLLPSFPGAHAHKDAIDYGAKKSGCTVHLVDEGIDSGPIIMQKTVNISEGETEKSLSSKILPYEHKILPKTLQLLCSGKIIVSGRKTKIMSD